MALSQTIGDRTYTYSHSVGSNQSCSAPTDMVLDSAGAVYTVSRGSEPGGLNAPRWTKWDLENDERVFDAGSQGSADGQLLWPNSLALDEEGSVYITDEYLNRVSIFSSTGTFLSQWGDSGKGQGQLDGPTGMRFDSTGNLVIAESRNNRVQKFTKDGKFLGQWGHGGSEPGELDMPFGIYIDSQDNVYVADWGNSRVQKFTPEGKLLVQFGSSGSSTGQLSNPTGVAVDKDGDVYVTDWGNNRVQVYDTKGEFITSFYGDAREPSKSAARFLAANPDYVKARKRADTREEWGFRRPTAVAVDEQNRILIIESISGRIQFYQKEDNYSDPQFNL